MSEVKNSRTERWRETEILYSWGSSKGFGAGGVGGLAGRASKRGAARYPYAPPPHTCGKGSSLNRICSEGGTLWNCSGSTVEPTVVVRYCMRKPLAMVSLMGVRLHEERAFRPKLALGCQTTGRQGIQIRLLALDRAVARAVLASQALTKGKPLLGV